ncbi:hypothetical protein RRG08_039619 [Elysia crispata]|uniref:Uncharacterized protein n=1 Tax=Elysia crispata TaxID=231223 RepID=A0AAE0Y9U0_9GAST|nr:hypothetical protein RRG08_039619 [Elysia crispata]
MPGYYTGRCRLFTPRLTGHDSGAALYSSGLCLPAPRPGLTSHPSSRHLVQILPPTHPPGTSSKSYLPPILPFTLPIPTLAPLLVKPRASHWLSSASFSRGLFT